MSRNTSRRKEFLFSGVSRGHMGPLAEPWSYDELMVKLVAGRQFTGPMIAECFNIAESLGRAGRFSRLFSWHRSRPRPVVERVGGGQPEDVDSRDFSDVVIVDFRRSVSPPASLHFSLASRPEYLLWDPPLLIYRVHERWLSDDLAGKSLRALLKAFLRWAVVVHAHYGWVGLRSDHGPRIGPYHGSRPLGQPVPLTDTIDRVSWANYFGPELIQTLGCDRLTTTPAWRAEQTSEGGIVLTLGESPMNPNDPENAAIRLAVIRRLGLIPRAPDQGR